MDFKNFLIVILSDLIKLSLSFKTKTSVRVEADGMRYGLRNDMIMRNVIYAEWLKEINSTKKHSRLSLCLWLWRKSLLAVVSFTTFLSP